MAKVKGSERLTQKVQAISKLNFEKIVQRYTINLKSSLKYVRVAMLKKLVNSNVNDGKTDFPHRRNGNLARNLIDLNVDPFNRNKVKQNGTKLSYRITVTSRLDGGTDSDGGFHTVVSRRGFNYARYLNVYNKKYSGYFGRLQKIFLDEIRAKHNNTFIKSLGG